MGLPKLPDLPESPLRVERKTLVKFNKQDFYTLEVCKPVIVRRERPLWREDRLDKYHLMRNNKVRHTPL